MDTEVKIWVDSVLGSFAFNRRLLAWDSYECHMEDSITESLKSKKIDRVIVPGGCTKYIQAPDVSWNKPRAQRSTMNGWEQLELMKKLPLEIREPLQDKLYYNGFWTLGLSFQQKL